MKSDKDIDAFSPPEEDARHIDGGERKDDDNLWKDIVQRFFYPMLQRAIPALYGDADREKKPRFLDKELRKVAYALPGGAHVADFLIEVPLKNGACEWVLLHIEVQAKGGDSLPFRMFHYKSLIFAIYKRESVALALVTDKRPKNEPESYRSSLYNTVTAYEYNRLVVPELDEAGLLETDNPFDLALCAACRALKSKRNERQKHHYLKELLGLLGDRGWSHDDKHKLLLFMERIINLRDRELRLDIVKYQEELEKEGKIMYVSLAEQAYWEKGKSEGKLEGKLEGKQEGLKEGLHKGILQTARNMKALGLPLDVIAKATGLSETEVRLLD